MSKALQEGDRVWIAVYGENCSPVMVEATLLRKHNDNEWVCMAPFYNAQEALEPFLDTYLRDEPHIYTNVGDLLAALVDEFRDKVKTESSDYWDTMAIRKFYHEQYLKGLEEPKKPAWKEGDEVWFYTDDNIVRDGTIVGTDDGDGLWIIEYVFIGSDNDLDRECVARAEGEMWHSMEDAARDLSEDLREEILRNSISLYDEQKELKERGELRKEISEILDEGTDND